MNAPTPATQTSLADWSAAEELALARGCVLENSCWGECVEAALHDVRADR